MEPETVEAVCGPCKQSCMTNAWQGPCEVCWDALWAAPQKVQIGPVIQATQLAKQCRLDLPDKARTPEHCKGGTLPDMWYIYIYGYVSKHRVQPGKFD